MVNPHDEDIEIKPGTDLGSLEISANIQAMPKDAKPTETLKNLFDISDQRTSSVNAVRTEPLLTKEELLACLKPILKDVDHLSPTDLDESRKRKKTLLTEEPSSEEEESGEETGEESSEEANSQEDLDETFQSLEGRKVKNPCSRIWSKKSGVRSQQWVAPYSIV